MIPVEPQPADILFDRIDVLDIFLARICVIEPQVAESVEFSGETEIETDGFRMSDVQIAVRLRWKTRVDPAAVLVLLKVLDNYVSDKMRGC